MTRLSMFPPEVGLTSFFTCDEIGIARMVLFQVMNARPEERRDWDVLPTPDEVATVTQMDFHSGVIANDFFHMIRILSQAGGIGTDGAETPHAATIYKKFPKLDQ